MPNFSLEVHALKEDNTRIAGTTAFSYANRPSIHLATNGDQIFIHANVGATIRPPGGVNQSFRFRLWRRWRAFTLLDDVKMIVRASAEERRWIDDNQGGGGWMDAPGLPISRQIARTTRQQQMNEFVIALDGRQREANAVYFRVIQGVASGQYRVRMTEGLSIGFDQWPMIEASAPPWSGGNALPYVQDTGWQMI